MKQFFNRLVARNLHDDPRGERGGVDQLLIPIVMLVIAVFFISTIGSAGQNVASQTIDGAFENQGTQAGEQLTTSGETSGGIVDDILGGIGGLFD